jgi:hypothetical protein
MVSNLGREITQTEISSISSIFSSSYERVATIEKAILSFQTTETHPFNPYVFTDEDFEPSSMTNWPDPNKEVEESTLGNSNDDTERPELASPSTLFPLPRATHEINREKSEKKSEVTTASPYKKALMASSTSKRKGKAKEKATKEKKKLTVDPATPVSSKDAEENMFCPGRDEEFEEPVTEVWVQREDCQQWWHVACSRCEGTGVFKCDSC